MNRIKKAKEVRVRHPPQNDYRTYIFSRQELAAHILLGALSAAVTAWLFYDSVTAWFLLMPFVLLSLKDKGRQLCRKKNPKARSGVSGGHSWCVCQLTGRVQRGKCISGGIQGYCAFVWFGMRDGCGAAADVPQAGKQ